MWLIIDVLGLTGRGQGGARRSGCDSTGNQLEIHPVPSSFPVSVNIQHQISAWIYLSLCKLMEASVGAPPDLLNQSEIKVKS